MAPVAASGEAVVRRPAQQLALALADLPPGFRAAEELAPSISPAQTGPDPWGRLSAYSATYTAATAAPSAPVPPPPFAEVVSSVNSYSGVSPARTAFTSWQDAVPPVYRAVERRPPATAEAVTYMQSSRAVCLVGFRTLNVIASVWVAATPGTETPPVDHALHLAEVVARRVAALAGR